MEGQFECAACGYTYTRAEDCTKETMEAETVELYGEIPTEEMVSTCDWCYDKIVKAIKEEANQP